MYRSGGSFFYASNESNSRSVFYLVHANTESYNTFHIHIVKREHRGNGCENMKKGMWGVVILALVLITGLSVFYWVDVGEKVVTGKYQRQRAGIPHLFCGNREKADCLYF